MLSSMQIFICDFYVIYLWAQRKVENNKGDKLLLTTSKINTEIYCNE